MFVLLQVLLRICNKYFLIVQELHKITAFCSSIYLYVDLILFQFPYRDLKLKRHNQESPKSQNVFSLLDYVHNIMWNLLYFGLLWQRSKCAESPIYQLFTISYFEHAYPKFNRVLTSRLTGILVYGHVDIIFLSRSEITILAFGWFSAWLCRFKFPSHSSWCSDIHGIGKMRWIGL